MTKKRLSYSRILTHLVTSSGIRDIARDLEVSASTICNRVSRLARQALSSHATLLGHLSLTEDLVADGFESFAVSQYFPNNIHLLAGKDSQFWYATDYAHLRRKGRMTARQKRRNLLLQKSFSFGRTTIYSSFSRIVCALDALAVSGGRSSLTLYTDRHTQYRRVLRSRVGDLSVCVRHRTIGSRRLRSVRNLLFSVNYLDREIRKDCAEHGRQTVKFARNVSNSLERLAIYRYYHNYMKPFRIGEREYVGVSHGMKAGIAEAVIRKEVKSFFTQRRFLFKTVGLSFSEALVWLRGVVTPLKTFAEYLPAYAWQ